MDERTRNQIIQQYNNAEEKIASLPISSTEEIIQAAYQSVLRALLVSVKADEPADQLTEEAFTTRITVLSGIAKAMDAFATTAGNRPLTPEQQRAIDQIEQIDSKITALKDKYAHLDDEVRLRQAEIAVRTEKLAEPQKRKNELEQKIKELKEQEKELTPEILENLNNKCKELEKAITEARDIYTRLLAKEKVGNEDLDEQRELNESKQAEIDAQPDELKRLQQEYEKLEQRLEETQNAAERCSEEKQEELRKQIEKEEPQANALKARYEAIAEQAERVRSLSNEAQSKIDKDLTALWPELLHVFQCLKERIGERKAELETLECEARAFDTHVKECNEKLERLKQWYQAEKTPLEALMDKVGSTNSFENEHLLKTWDVNQSETVRQHMEKAEGILVQLGDLLRDATAAAEEDERRMRRRVDTNERIADAEKK